MYILENIYTEFYFLLRLWLLMCGKQGNTETKTKNLNIRTTKCQEMGKQEPVTNKKSVLIGITVAIVNPLICGLLFFTKHYILFSLALILTIYLLVLGIFGKKIIQWRLKKGI